MIRLGLRSWVRTFALGLLCLLPLVTLGQQSRTPSVGREQAVEEASAAYRRGQYAEAEALLERYKSMPADKLPAEVRILTDRLALVARLAAHRDDLPLIDSLNVPMTELAPNLEQLLEVGLGRSGVGRFQLELRSDSLWHYRFTPELGRVCLESVGGSGADTARRLDRIGGAYVPREESFPALGDHLAMPVLLSDGVRIVFSRQTDEGLGGYDLYFSRMNVDTEQYLRPTLLGLPYSSPANDYLLVYDEVAERTLLVSDRYAPPGLVTIYRYRGCPRMLGGRAAQEGQEIPED